MTGPIQPDVAIVDAENFVRLYWFDPILYLDKTKIIVAWSN